MNVFQMPDDAPAGIKALRRDPRGYPVPWFIPDGSDDLRIADGKKAWLGWRDGLCWICGLKLGSPVALIGGPLAILNQCFGDWAMHLECAEFSMKNCPFLNGRQKKRVHKEGDELLPIKIKEGFIEERPPYQAIYVVKHWPRIISSGHIIASRPERVLWYKDGVLVPDSEVKEVLDAAKKKLDLEAAAAKEKAKSNVWCL